MTLNSHSTANQTTKPKDIALSLSMRVQRIKPSPTLAVSARAEELEATGKKIINLGVGEPDFDTPDFIKTAAIKAIKDGHTKYTAVDGIKPLRQAIVDKLARENALEYQLNQILVSCGAKHSIFNLLTAILNPGDEVIIPSPYWASYPDIVKLTDGVAVIAKTDFSQKFKMTAVQLQSAITPKTRALILNSPSNPTGMAYTKSDWQALGEVLLHHPNILIISDDIYEHNLWNALPFQNIVNACPELYDRTVIINGVSKAYAMTGWRIGYAAGPANLIAAMKKVQSQSTSNPTSISQYAALAALEGNQACVQEMTSAYKERHDHIIKELTKMPGINVFPSDGTFYTFPQIQELYSNNETIKTDIDFSEFLLEQAGIAVVPGTAFGAPGHIRMSFATGLKELKDAIKKLKQAIKKL